MTLLHQLTALAAPWADFYNASKAAQSTVMFGHFGGMMTGGGLALATDRATIRAGSASPEEQRRHLRELSTIHPLIVGALGLTALTGLLMFAADLETLALAPVFWLKMSLILLLLGNGYLMLRAERQLEAGDPLASPHWRRLRTASLVSLGLWFAVVLVGSILPNVA